MNGISGRQCILMDRYKSEPATKYWLFGNPKSEAGGGAVYWGYYLGGGGCYFLQAPTGTGDQEKNKCRGEKVAFGPA